MRSMKKMIENIPFEFTDKSPQQREILQKQLVHLRKEVYKGLVKIMNGVLEEAYPEGYERLFMIQGWQGLSQVALIERVKDFGFLAPEYYAIIDIRPQLREIRRKVMFTFTRYLVLDEVTHESMVCGAGLILPKEMQNGGYGRKILEKETELYRSLGFTKFFLPASLPMGIYFFAREGFDFRTGCSRGLYIDDVKKRIEQIENDARCTTITVGDEVVWKRGEGMVMELSTAPQIALLKAWDENEKEITFSASSRIDYNSQEVVERKDISLGKAIFLDNAREGNQIFWRGIKEL